MNNTDTWKQGLINTEHDNIQPSFCETNSQACSSALVVNNIQNV